jgi:hypothetical protein
MSKMARKLATSAAPVVRPDQRAPVDDRPPSANMPSAPSQSRDLQLRKKRRSRGRRVREACRDLSGIQVRLHAQLRRPRVP